jgi:hypothetical protein
MRQRNEHPVSLKSPLRVLTLALLLVSPAAASPTRFAVICTNPYSGMSWRVAVDTARSTVDSYRAHISGAEISWHDSKDGADYTLKLNSGELSAVYPSSTGGYFLHDRCVRAR